MEWQKGTPEEIGAYIVLQYWSTGDAICRNVLLAYYSEMESGEKCFWHINRDTHEREKIKTKVYAWIKVPKYPEWE